MTDLIQTLENITSKFRIPKEITNINLTITTEDGSYSMSYNRHPTARSLGMYSIKDSFNSFLQKVDKKKPKYLLGDRAAILILDKSSIHKELIDIILNTDQNEKQKKYLFLEEFLKKRSELPTDYVKVDNLRSSASTNSLNPLTLSREHVIDLSEFIIDVNDSCKLKRKKHN